MFYKNKPKIHDVGSRDNINSVITIKVSCIICHIDQAGRTSCINYRNLIKKNMHTSERAAYIMRTCRKETSSLPPKTFQRRIVISQGTADTFQHRLSAKPTVGEPHATVPGLSPLDLLFLLFFLFFSLIFLFSGPECLALLGCSSRVMGRASIVGVWRQATFTNFSQGLVNCCVRARVLCCFLGL